MGLELNVQYEIGKLHGKVDALEGRADKQETTLIQMDGKLDQILTAQSKADGGQDKIASLAKYGIAFLAALGSLGGLVVAFVHYIVDGGK